jgi:(p)ppGpp synthase/HD superfamily hydrolase
MNDIVAIMKKRKGEEAEPYLNHLIEVASLVAEFTDGRPEVVIAALLHDAVEDQGVTNAEIADLFGQSVASLVDEATDDKSLLKEVRKDNQIADAQHKSDGASVIKLADKTSNLLAIAKSPPPWPKERKRAYVDWARSVVSGLPFKPAGLLARFDEAARLAMESIERQG